MKQRLSLLLFGDQPNVQVHPDCFGITDKRAHVDIFRPPFRATELGSAGAHSFGEFSLGQSLTLALLGELESDGNHFRFFFKDLPDDWVGELLV